MISLVLLPFDVDPNVVKPGWTPLIITIVLALAMVGLFISMRRQFRRIDTNRAAGHFDPPGEHADADAQPNADATPSDDVLPEADLDAQPESRPAAGPTS